MRQAWPETVEAPGAWPQAFQRQPPLVLSQAQARHRAGARRWSSRSCGPGSSTRPIQSGQNCRSSWIEQTSRRQGHVARTCSTRPSALHDELHQPKPPAFLPLHRSGRGALRARRGAPAPPLLGDLSRSGLGDPRLRAMMSLRADFFGELQNDEPLFNVHRQINVPPLREAELREVVSRPAELLSARFETAGLADDHRPAHRRGVGQGRRRAAAAVLLCSTTCGRRWSSAATACCASRCRPSSLAACWSIAPMHSSPLIRTPRTRCAAFSR